MSLLIKNQLKTTLNIGNAENLGKITLPVSYTHLTLPTKA